MSASLDPPLDEQSNLMKIPPLTPPDVVGKQLPLQRQLGVATGLSLSQYLARQICMWTFTGVGSSTIQIRQYLTEFLELDSIAQKLKFMALVRGTIHIDFVITTTPYACGQFIATTFMGPIASHNAPSIDATLLTFNFTTKEHIILDTSLCNTGTIKVPIHSKYPYINMYALDTTQDAFLMAFTSLTPIISTLDGTDAPYTVKVFLSLHDSEITIPTPYGVTDVYTMSEVRETINGSISYPASILANIGKALSDVPVIGPFAYATSLVASAVSTSAVLFGMSRPKDISPMNYPHEENFTDYAGNLRVKTLTLDPLQEIPMDNSFIGETGDSLTYKNIIQREGLLQRFTWSNSSPTTTMVFRLPVSPCLALVSSSNVWQATPLCYGSQLFNEWRGTIRYRIVIPANAFVRGKLRIFWSPISIPNLATSYQDISQNAPSVIIDLASKTEATLDVPWGRQLPFIATVLLGSTIQSSCNGFLYAMVEEQLTCPAASLSLSVLVWVSAGEDFDFQIPTVVRLQYLRRQLWDPAYNDDIIIDPNIYQLQSVPNITPIPAILSTDTIYQSYTSLNMTDMSISEVLLPETDGDSAAIHHMGEKFNSFRPLLKRFFPYSLITEGTTSAQFYSDFLPYLGVEPFFRNPGSGVLYPEIMLTPARYLSNLFYGVRGSVRYRLNYNSESLTHDHNMLKIQVQRDFRAPDAIVYENRTYEDAPYPRWINAKSFSGAGEAGFNVKVGEPVYFEIPYQCVSQYQTTEIKAFTGPIVYGASISYFNCSAPMCEVYSSVGEDFNPVIWNGVPMLSVFPPGKKVVG